MALHDYHCPQCGGILDDVFRTAAQGIHPPPACPACGLPMEWIPNMRIDVGGVKGASFHAFDVDVDGTRTRIDSLHTMRRVERESEQRYRNGEGEPLRFRAWSQDTSNRDVGSFGTAGKIGDQVYDSGTPAPARAKVGVTRHGQRKPRVTLGPGMRGAVSALKG